MQRIARFTLQNENQSAIDLLSHYDELMRIIVRYLPPSTATLFARPELQADGKTIEWYSDLQGQPYLLGNSVADQQKLAEIRPHLTQRLQSIAQLNQHLTKQGAISAEQSRWLTLLVDGASHHTAQIYVVNNEPVITGWGVGEKPVISSPPVAIPVKKHRWCLWLLPLLLLLALLLWWWFGLRVSEKQPELPKTEPVIEQPKESKIVEEIKPDPPKVEPVKPEVIEPVKAEPEVVTQPPVEEKAVEPEKPKTPEAPKKVCSISTKPGENPQMVIIFDNSRSMLYSLLENNQSIEQFHWRWDRDLVTAEDFAYMRRSPNRLEVAKKSSSSIINSIAKTVDIGLVELRGCPAANNHGYYSPAKRKQLRAKISAMQPAPDNDPNAGGTPLYSGLQKAASMIDGKKRDGFILILSDGQDSCEVGDVCALAEQIAQRQPRLKINVVDIGGAKGANCVAKATGGKVFTANSQKQLINMINQAVKPITEVEVCK
ncbi:hypothetical protein K7G91_001522 [Pasteurella canis]|uniref:hypothetical protein n=1 Tax=Pasteurella canis TaxID=753 RepID=UPI001D119343|nr:hypothetical protein [Pasteurella canis]UDW83197.1 hypothetical protein K7G91_001522 [Pasteurella canis]